MVLLYSIHPIHDFFTNKTDKLDFTHPTTPLHHTLPHTCRRTRPTTFINFHTRQKLTYWTSHTLAHLPTTYLQESQADHTPDDGPGVGAGRVSKGLVARGHVDLWGGCLFLPDVVSAPLHHRGLAAGVRHTLHGFVGPVGSVLPVGVVDGAAAVVLWG